MKSEFTPFPSIEGFAHAAHNQSRLNSLSSNTSYVYVLKPKLHGTNAGVRIDPDGSVQPQSRKRDITLDYDNFDFAIFVEKHKEYFASLAQSDAVVIFGEWAGAGVQSTDAINKLDRRVFFPFAVQIGEQLFSDVNVIDVLLGEAPADVMNLPAIGYVDIDFARESSVQEAVKEINRIVVEFEGRDPYVFDTFGFEDVGEGVVGCPLFDGGMDAETFGKLSFKAKTQNHRGRKAKAAATGRFDLDGDARAIALSYLTEARFNQALREGVDDQLDIRRVRDFLAWMGADVKKESQAEFEAAGIEWKAVAGLVSKASAEWYKDRIARFGQQAA